MVQAEEHKIVGDILRQQSRRYTVRFNQNTGAWHLLDLWDESLQKLSPDSPIPDDCPALTILPADAFNILMSEADRLGIIGRIFGPGASAEPLKSPEDQSGEERPLGKSMELGADQTFEAMANRLEEETLSQTRTAPQEGVVAEPQRRRSDDEFYNFKLRQQALDLVREIVVPLHVRGLID